MSIRTEKRIEVRPNSSLSPRGSRVFLLSTGVACLGPGIALTSLGYWPVLPFAGLEFAALATATWWSIRKGRYREIIVIRNDRVTVSKLGPGERSRVHMPLHWCRPSLRAGKTRWSPQKLVLQSGLTECEVASCCTDSERVRLWKRLKVLIGPVNQTPHSRLSAVNPGAPGSDQEVETHVQ